MRATKRPPSTQRKIAASLIGPPTACLQAGFDLCPGFDVGYAALYALDRDFRAELEPHAVESNRTRCLSYPRILESDHTGSICGDFGDFRNTPLEHIALIDDL